MLYPLSSSLSVSNPHRFQCPVIPRIQNMLHIRIRIAHAFSPLPLHYHELASHVLSTTPTHLIGRQCSNLRLYLHSLWNPLPRGHIRLRLAFLALSPGQVVHLVGLCPRELRRLVVIEGLLVAFSTAPRVERLHHMCLFRLVGAEGVATEFGVGPTCS